MILTQVWMHARYKVQHNRKECVGCQCYVSIWSSVPRYHETHSQDVLRARITLSRASPPFGFHRDPWGVSGSQCLIQARLLRNELIITLTVRRSEPQKSSKIAKLRDLQSNSSSRVPCFMRHFESSLK